MAVAVAVTAAVVFYFSDLIQFQSCKWLLIRFDEIESKHFFFYFFFRRHVTMTRTKYEGIVTFNESETHTHTQRSPIEQLKRDNQDVTFTHGMDLYVTMQLNECMCA